MAVLRTRDYRKQRCKGERGTCTTVGGDFTPFSETSRASGPGACEAMENGNHMEQQLVVTGIYDRLLNKSRMRVTKVHRNHSSGHVLSHKTIGMVFKVFNLTHNVCSHHSEIKLITKTCETSKILESSK